jgi:hypothetical protein
MARSYFRIEITGFGNTRTGNSSNDVDGIVNTLVANMAAASPANTLFTVKLQTDFQERNMINDPIAATVPV